MGVPYAEVIGDPIAHSKSPLIHKFWLDKLGLDGDYRATLVRPNDLGEYLISRRSDPDWCGSSVTLPHKGSILTHLDDVEAAARRVNAANCIVRKGRKNPRLIGLNTDVAGFLEPLLPWLTSKATYRHAQIIGAGGAAAAATCALVSQNFSIVTINRSADKAFWLRRRLGLDQELTSPLDQLMASAVGDRKDVLDVFVNATPLGMRGFPPLELNPNAIPSDSVVYDLVYDPLETDLLRTARARSNPTISGIEMLVAQAAQAFQYFLGRPRRANTIMSFAGC